MPIEQYEKISVLRHYRCLPFSRCTKDLNILRITEAQIVNSMCLDIERQIDPRRDGG